MNDIKGNKKIIHAWSMYDWANSVYSLVITSTIFPIYYGAVTRTELSDKVYFFGFEFINTSLLAFAVSCSFLIVALFSPLLSSIADYTGRKKQFMQFFTYLGVLSCASLFFFNGHNIELGILAYIVASIGYSGSLVFYNAYLPEIAAPKDQDRVSARGFALGYIGSVILMIICLIIIQQPLWFGIENASLPARISFLLVAVWWLGFAAYTFKYLPKNIFNVHPKGAFVLHGYKELIKVWHKLKSMKILSWFLPAFFFYTMGVQTVMYMAASYGEKVLNLPEGILISTILIIQLVAILGSYGFAKSSEKRGNIPTLIIAVCIWIVICFAAYFVTESVGFMILAAFVGLVMGGIQSLSRSTYSKLLPSTHNHASFFSFYDVAEKMAIVLGTASFGFIELLTGSMRNSVFALALFFIIGLFLLFKVKQYQAHK